MPTDASLTALRATVAAPLPHPNSSELRTAIATITEWALDHFTTLPARSVGATAAPAFLRSQLHMPPPEQGLGFAASWDAFTTKVVPYAYSSNHPKFLAFVPGAPTFPSIMGDWLTAATNYFAGVWLEAAAPSQIETTVLDWFRTWLGLPPTTKGVLTGGGSEANLTALVVARQQQPFQQRERLVLYMAAERHWSIDRAAMIMGLHPEQLRVVPVDAELRMRGVSLHESVQRDRVAGLTPWAVVANAGATNTGTIDALTEISDVCRVEGLWFHVDAAYGWPGIFTNARTELQTLALADSVTLDPHKWFAQTFEAGCVLVRDGELLPATFANRPDYMHDVVPEADAINYADHGIALTRRFRALKIWFSMQLLGLEWFRRLAQHGCNLAAYAQAVLERAGFTILCEARLGIVCFRYEPQRACDIDALNARIIDELRHTGRVFLSSTRLRGRLAQRMCFVNWRTTATDIDEVVELLALTGRRLEAN